MFAIAGGLEGFMKKKLPWWQRLIAIIGGLGMIDPNLTTDFFGILLILIVALMTGIGGLCVLTIATLLGLVPQYAGTSRIPLTGCLLLPVILSGLM